jgi:hypothetical protein
MYTFYNAPNSPIEHEIIGNRKRALKKIDLLGSENTGG